jgi:hypothetical protein
MENRNVLTWNQALEKGLNPSDYPFHTESVPVGKFPATLDFKIWAKKTMGISCFFTIQEDQRKFQLTVFRRSTDRQYMLENCDCDIDFSVCKTAETYIVRVAVNGKGNISFKNASFFSHGISQLNKIIETRTKH